MKKATIVIANLAIFLTLSGGAFAQTDTEITPQDLGVSKARILPGNPFYGFKNIIRGVQEGLARNSVKKAELQLRHANEKIVEAQQLIEEKKTDKAQQAAVKLIGDVNKDFDKIVRQSENLAGSEKFLEKIADNSLKQQVVLQRLGEQVPEDVFTKIEASRQQHLEKFGQVMTKVAGNAEQIGNLLPQIIEKQQGSDFKELKAVEILKDLEDKVSPEQREALRLAQLVMSQRFEQRFAAMPQEARQEKFQNYVQSMPGNPVRQFETFETMKRNFQSPEAVQEMELAKDRAVQKFENRFGQFQGEEARKEFMAPWTNGDPEDLRTMTEMQMRMEPSANFQQFQLETQNNFKERFSDNPEALRQNQVFQRMENKPDIVDLKMAQQLGEIPAFKQFQSQATEKFIENIQEGRAPANPPIPGGLKVLQEIRVQLPAQAQKGMDQAIKVQEKINQQPFRPQAIPLQPKENNVGGTEGTPPQGGEPRPSGGPQKPIVPMTPERVQMFEEKQPILAPIKEAAPVQRIEPQETAPILSPSTAPAPAPVQ